MKPEPLQGKELIFEQDYIETDIKWGLALGDKIFKKSEVKSAAEWLKEKLRCTCGEKHPCSVCKTSRYIFHYDGKICIGCLIDKAFVDVVKK